MKKLKYQEQLDDLLEGLNDRKPSLLLHACCGPCSSYVLEYLCKFFQITVFYYNPNIYPQAEYERRLNELKNLYLKFPPALENNIKVIEEKYDPEDFYNSIKIKTSPELATEPEKGTRCYRCYEFRLQKAFEYAHENHFEYFCTTLSISPFKDAEKINSIGQKISDGISKEKNHPLWLPSDFKKKNGFKRSLEISAEYDLYRQDYCGCIYSMNNRK